MKHLVLSITLLSMTALHAGAQVGIGTTQPATTLHLYEDSGYPVIRLEGTASGPDEKSSRVEWVYQEASTGKGYSAGIIDGEFRVSRLTEGSLATQAFPAIRLDPEHMAVNMEEGSGEVTGEVNLSVNGSIAAGIRTITSDYDLSAAGDQEDYTILADATSGNITVTLCSAAGQKGRLLVIKKIAGMYTVTIDGYMSEKIDGSYLKVLNSEFDFVSIHSDGAKWYIIGNN